MNSGHLLKWQPIVCAVALLLSVLLIHPFVEMGFCDDFSYVRTAKYLADTGHLNYFGWATPMLGWQLLLGALFVKLFGFSFTIVRSVVFLVAIASSMLLQRTFVRCGLNERNAVIATLILVLSPLYLALSFSFMSDVAGLFSIVLCLYSCIRALQAEDDHSAFRWWLAAAFLGALTGTVRQISWLGVLVLVPSTLWLLRRRRLPVGAAIAVWLLCVGFVFAMLHWFQHQPFTQQEKIIRSAITSLNVYNLKLYIVKFSLGFSFSLLPILIVFFTSFVLRRRRYLTFVTITVIAIGLAIAFGLHHSHRPAIIDILAPFNGDFVTAVGAVDVPTIGQRTIVLGTHLRLILTLISFTASLSFVCFLFHIFFSARRQKAVTKTEIKAGNTSSAEPTLSWHQIAVLFGPFTLAYLCLLIPRGLFASIVDRYALPLLVLALVVIIRLYQQKISPNLPAVTLAALAVFAAYGIAATHDKFQLQRAQLAAAQELLNASVPRDAFFAGFEYDGWTQIDDWGYVVNERINFPPGFHPYNVVPTPPPCGLASARLFPAIHPNYAVSFQQDTCEGPSQFASITYHNWLPPYARTIYIQRVAAPPAN